MEQVIDLSQWNEVKSQLKALPESALNELEWAMSMSSTYLAGLMKEYAPESEANRPGRLDEFGNPLPWYERGRGSWRPVVSSVLPDGMGVRSGYTSATVSTHFEVTKTGGATKRVAIKRVIGYKLRPTSQQLGKHWTAEVQRNAHEIIGKIGNTVTYMPYVQIAELQWWKHWERGWQTEESNLEKAMPEINKLFDESIRKILSKFGE